MQCITSCIQCLWLPLLPFEKVHQTYNRKLIFGINPAYFVDTLQQKRAVTASIPVEFLQLKKMTLNWSCLGVV